MYFQKIFQSNGISKEIYSLINNEDVRPTANLVISKCSAYEYLDNSKPNLEKLTTQYYETFSITGRFTGYFSNRTIGDFYNDLSSTYDQPTAILGGLNATTRKGKSDSENTNIITNPESLTAGTSSIIGKRGTENFGLALFKEDKFIGELSAVESMCHLLIQNKINSCIISINDPISKKENEKIELQIFPRQNTKINVTIENNIPHIFITLNLHADIMTLDKDIEYETNDVLSQISNTAEEYLTNQFYEYLNIISTEFNSDIDNFHAKASSHFSNISDWENFNWNEKFKDSVFDVNINVNVLSTMLITKT